MRAAHGTAALAGGLAERVGEALASDAVRHELAETATRALLEAVPDRSGQLEAVAGLAELTADARVRVRAQPVELRRGRTPDEVYGGLGVTIPDDLEDARAEARLARLEANRARRCGACASPSRSPPSANALAA